MINGQETTNKIHKGLIVDELDCFFAYWLHVNMFVCHIETNIGHSLTDERAFRIEAVIEI